MLLNCLNDPVQSITNRKSKPMHFVFTRTKYGKVKGIVICLRNSNGISKNIVFIFLAENLKKKKTKSLKNKVFNEGWKSNETWIETLDDDDFDNNITIIIIRDEK